MCIISHLDDVFAFSDEAAGCREPSSMFTAGEGGTSNIYELTVYRSFSIQSPVGGSGIYTLSDIYFSGYGLSENMHM